MIVCELVVIGWFFYFEGNFWEFFILLSNCSGIECLNWLGIVWVCEKVLNLVFVFVGFIELNVLFWLFNWFVIFVFLKFFIGWLKFFVWEVCLKFFMLKDLVFEVGCLKFFVIDVGVLNFFVIFVWVFLNFSIVGVGVSNFSIIDVCILNFVAFVGWFSNLLGCWSKFVFGWFLNKDGCFFVLLKGLFGWVEVDVFLNGFVFVE